ncbi:GPO family capsid scaffolding protein [Serratia ficaria]|uniref:GPO family capsid scaffolding protein n=1 Tax=Serratia ficaria TaxID=61651 RepID=UPI0021CA31F4|nr:GPO family capsid scaffolding protein [Serratia ficaria]
MKKTLFLVAISGNTIDGRELPAADIVAIANNYDSKTYAAGIYFNFENWTSAVGTVMGLKAELVDGKAHLYAEVKVCSELLESAKGWTLPNYFAVAIQYDSSLPSPYLVGLSPTTEPVIEGTDVITFSILAGCLA